MRWFQGQGLDTDASALDVERLLTKATHRQPRETKHDGDATGSGSSRIKDHGFHGWHGCHGSKRRNEGRHRMVLRRGTELADGRPRAPARRANRSFTLMDADGRPRNCSNQSWEWLGSLASMSVD